MKPKNKRLAKMIGIGLLILIPLAFFIYYFLAKIKMDNTLSIFLIVLGLCIVCFVYYLIYTKIESNKQKKWESDDDPFSK